LLKQKNQMFCRCPPLHDISITPWAWPGPIAFSDRAGAELCQFPGIRIGVASISSSTITMEQKSSMQSYWRKNYGEVRAISERVKSEVNSCGPLACEELIKLIQNI